VGRTLLSAAFDFVRPASCQCLKRSLVILRPALFAGRRIYGLADSAVLMWFGHSCPTPLTLLPHASLTGIT
jgi:hypothetical protein